MTMKGLLFKMSKNPVGAYRTRPLFITILCISFGLTGCGKVIQEAPKSSESPTFDIVYTVKLTDPTGKTAPPWTLQEMTIFIDVSQIDASGRANQESSGKAILKKREPLQKTAKTPTVSIGEYISTAFRPDGVTLTGASDFKWSKASFDAKSQLWSIDSKKIKRGSPFYRISAFTDASSYKLKIIDDKTVSKNALVTVGEITDYDTFLATLFSASLTLDKAVIDIPNYFSELSQFYSLDTFYALKLTLPDNKTPKFKYDLPSFVFSSPQEVQLLTLYDLFRANPKEALSTLKTKSYPWLTDKGKALLIKATEAALKSASK